MNVNGKLVIAIDFDGTIVEHEYPEIGELKYEAKDVINKLYEEGHSIIIWTCRSNANGHDFNDMIDFLIDNDIMYTEANENDEVVSYGCYPKIYADIYIDDRNLFHIDDWNIIYNEIKRIEELKCK